MFQRTVSFVCMAVFVAVCSLSFAGDVVAQKAAVKKEAPKKAAPKKEAPKKAAPKKAKKKGFAFPPIKVPYFQYQKDQAFAKKTFNFATVVGKKPIVMFYFLPEHVPSMTELKALSVTARILGSKMSFFGVTRARTVAEAKKAYKKMKEMNITLPVLLDKKGLMAYVMLTRRVPSYAMVTKSGRFTLARAAALTEKVNATSTVMGLMMQAAAGKETPFTIGVGYSPNPYNLIGKPAHSFNLPFVFGKGSLKLTDYVKKDKRPTILAFWSITCPHCQRLMPTLSKYLDARKKKVKALSLLILQNDQYKKVFEKFQKAQKLTVSSVNDSKGYTFNKYRIVTVPTLFIVDSKGVVRNVVVGAGKNIEQILDGMLAAISSSK